MSVGPGLDVARGCSRPPSACRWCRTRRGCAATARAASPSSRTDNCSRSSALVVKGNLRRSASVFRSSGCTPAASKAALVMRDVLVDVRRASISGACSCSAAISSREAISIGSKVSRRGVRSAPLSDQARHGVRSFAAPRSSAFPDWRSAPARNGNRPARGNRPPCSGGTCRAAPRRRGRRAGCRPR